MTSTAGRAANRFRLGTTRGQFSLRPRRNREGELFAGRYRLVKRIGMGGAGTVYLAVLQGTAKSIAVKVFDCADGSQTSSLDDSLRAARAASDLGHPHIVRVMDHGHTSDGLRFLVTEYLEGEDLATHIASTGPLPWARARNIAFQILDALATAHGRQLVHGGLRPEQCFLTRNEEHDEVKLLDFGATPHVRRPTAPYAADDDPAPFAPRVDMAAYVAPEQAAWIGSDERSDLYAFGVILFEMLTGRLPFDAPTATELLHQHMHAAPVSASHFAPDANISDEVDAVLLRLLAKEPSHRFPDARTVALVLATIDADETAPDHGSSWMFAPGCNKSTTASGVAENQDRIQAGGDASQNGGGLPPPPAGNSSAPPPAGASSAPPSSGAPPGGDDDDDEPAASRSGPFGGAPVVSETAESAPQLPTWAPLPADDSDEAGKPAARRARDAQAPDPVRSDRTPGGSPLDAFGSFGGSGRPPSTEPNVGHARSKTPVELPTLRVKPEQLVAAQQARKARRPASKTLIFTPSLPTAGTALPSQAASSPRPSRQSGRGTEATEPQLHQAPTRPEKTATSSVTNSDPAQAGRAAKDSQAIDDTVPMSPAAKSAATVEDALTPSASSKQTAQAAAPVTSDPSDANTSSGDPSDLTAASSKKRRKKTSPESQDAEQDARNRMSAAGSFRVDTMPDDVVRDLVQPLRERPQSGAIAAVDAPIADDDDWADTPPRGRAGWMVAVTAVAAIGGWAFWMSSQDTSAPADAPKVAQAAPQVRAEVTEIVPPLPDTPVADKPEGAQKPDFSEATVEPTAEQRPAFPGSDNAAPSHGAAAETAKQADRAGTEKPAGDPAQKPSETGGKRSPREPSSSSSSSKRDRKSKRPAKPDSPNKGADKLDTETSDNAAKSSQPSERRLKMPGKVTAAVKECGRKHGGMPGDRVSTKLVISDKGDVSNAKTSGRRVSGDLSACIEAAAKRGKYPGQSGEHTHYFTL